MRRGTQWLSRGAEHLAAEVERAQDGEQPTPVVDLLVVGSGYGGAVAAARMAESDWGRHRRIVLLERGREWLPGDFPDRMETAVPEVRVTTRREGGPRGRRDALYDVRVGLRQSVLVASGLGGGSLINAGVAEPADAQTLSDPAWPLPWRGDADLWATLYERARQGLGARRWAPQGTPRDAAMHALAGRLGSRSRPVTLTIEPPAVPHTHHALPPPLQPQPHAPCVSCGDCFSGCNVGAKRTLGTSYLQRARDGGVEIYTGASVLQLARAASGTGWDLTWTFTDPKRRPLGRRSWLLHARRVVLAAGTLGSTEILLRSAAAGLPLSKRLGRGFSGNGDVIGAQARLPAPARSWVDENASHGSRRVDPTITHQIELRRDHPDPLQRRVVQNLVAPGPLGWFYGELVTSLSLPHRWLRTDWSFHGRDRVDPAVADHGPAGLLEHTLLVAAFAHDGAGGRLRRLDRRRADDGEGFLVADAPRPAERAAHARWLACHAGTDALLKQATPSEADWLRQPLWQAAPDAEPLIDKPVDHAAVSVHPLGGCTMAATREGGVVDAMGRVFDAGAPDVRAVWPDLCVLDGSIVPGSLGINPLLTITALAEGITDRWRDDWLHADGPCAAAVTAPWPPRPPWPARTPLEPRRPAVPTVLRFEERMSGVLVDARQPDLSGDDARVRLNVRFVFDEVTDAEAFARAARKQLGMRAYIDVVRSSWLPQDRRQTDSEPLARLEGACRGTVHWMEQAPSCVIGRFVRSLRAWWQLRRQADLPDFDAHGQPIPSKWLQPSTWPDQLRKLLIFLRGLTHFGSPRLLRYEFTIPQGCTLAIGNLTLQGGDRLAGAKSFVYERGGNPWRQLTMIELKVLRRDAPPLPLATLRYDELFMIGRDSLPLAFGGASDGVARLRDTASVLLYLARVAFLQHYPSLRLPDYAPARTLDRLPRKPGPQDAIYAGIAFETGALAPSAQPERPLHRHHAGRPALRLSRYRQADAGGVPVLLIHGLGSGGVQFTHPAIPEPLAAVLARGGRDVWVCELRTSIGLPRHAESWSMDDVARHDLPDLVQEVLARTGQPQLDAVAHCIGSAMLWMALLDGRLQRANGQSLVRRVVAMQVGPIVHLPRPNRVRGYIGNRLQSLLRMKSVVSTIDDRARDGDRAVDRLLGSVLLGGADEESWRERGPEPSARIGPNLQHNGWLANAQRSAGVFAQLFQWKNLGLSQLRALGDLLGRVNLQTYEQTVQYTMLRRLTNANAESAYVTDQNLLAHATMPVLFVQGELNDVFAPRGTFDSARYLARVRGAGSFVGRLVVAGHGHLDCVVGNEAGTRVFAPVLAFLQAGDSPAALADAVRSHTATSRGDSFRGDFRDPADESINLRMPTVGPWLGHAERNANARATDLRIGLKVDERLPEPPVLVTMAWAGGQPIPASCTLWGGSTLTAGGLPKVEVLNDEGEAVIALTLDDTWWQHLPDDADIEIGVLAPNWQASDAAFWLACPNLPGQLATAWTQLREQWRVCDNQGRPLRPSRRDVEQPIDSVVLSVRWLKRLREPSRDWSFAVGACRQAPLLADRDAADAAWREMLDQRDRLDLVLLLGDQIYADALSIAMSSVDTRLRYSEAYREAWTAPHQRELMRRLPHAMAADDHEFRDDYVIERYRDGIDLDDRLAWRDAREPMWRYQFRPGVVGAAYAAAKARGVRVPPDRWYRFEREQARFFVADTRSERVDGGRVDRRGASMLGPRQWAALHAWFNQARDGKPSFLALPTPVAPVFAEELPTAGHPLRGDGWLRFPADLERLFRLILRHQPPRLVVLSGDYHCFADLRVELKDAQGRSAAFDQFVTGGLYCPYGFANTAEDELAWPATGQWWPAGPLQWRYDRRAGTAHVPASGFGRVDVDANGDVRFTPVLAANRPRDPSPA